MQTPPQRPVAREQRVEHERASRQHDADQALRQNGERQRCPAEEHPAALLARRRIGALRDQQCAQAATHPERQSRIQREHVGVEDVPGTAPEHRGGMIEKTLRNLRDRCMNLPGGGQPSEAQEWLRGFTGIK